MTQPAKAAQREAIVFAYLDEPPFCYPSPDGGALGSDVELVAEALRNLGVATFEMRLTSFAELLPGLVDGRWTITTPLFVTSERQEIVAFSRPVWALGDGLMVRQGDQARFDSYEALARDPGARLVIVADQVQEQSGLTAGIPPERILRVATQEDAVQAVKDGSADAYASVAMAHRGFLSRSPDAGLAVTAVTGGRPAAGAFALAKSSAGLKARLNRALDELIGTPWHREMMRRYGFDAEDYAFG